MNTSIREDVDLDEPGWRVQILYDEGGCNSAATTREMSLGEAVAFVKQFRMFEGRTWATLLAPEPSDDEDEHETADDAERTVAA